MTLGLASNIIFSSQALKIDLDQPSKNNLLVHAAGVLAQYLKSSDFQLESFDKTGSMYRAIFQENFRTPVQTSETQLHVEFTSKQYVAFFSKEMLQKLHVTLPELK